VVIRLVVEAALRDVASVFLPMMRDRQEMAARYSDDELRLIVGFYGRMEEILRHLIRLREANAGDRPGVDGKGAPGPGGRVQGRLWPGCRGRPRTAGGPRNTMHVSRGRVRPGWNPPGSRPPQPRVSTLGRDTRPGQTSA
jgi:hypothetical protein